MVDFLVRKVRIVILLIFFQKILRPFNIIDLGMKDRVYDPIRIMPDETTSRHNENLMQMNDDIVDYVVDRVLGKPIPEEDDE